MSDTGTKKKARREEILTGWLMALPAVILIFTFLVAPFIMAFGLSFTNQRLISPNPTEWVGLRNFQRLLTVKRLVIEPERNSEGQLIYDEDGEIIYPSVRSFTRKNPDYPKLDGLRELSSRQQGDKKIVTLARDVVFYKALKNTFVFVISIVPLQGGLALCLALLLNNKIKGINTYRTVFFIPVVVSMTIVAMLWRFIYDGNNGLLNTILHWITLGKFEPVDWLGNTRTALGAIIAMSAWQGVGFHMTIWLAGLQNIPLSLYEAASIDGANKGQQFIDITLPSLRNTMIFIFVIITMQAFGIFTQISVMTSGGPLDMTQTLVFQAVERGYSKQDIAGGSAISVIFFAIVLTISMVQRYLTREKD